MAIDLRDGRMFADVAFVVLAHRLPDQLIRLVDVLTAPGVSFYIHVDRDADAPTRDRVRPALAGREDVVFLPSRPTPWGSMGIALAMIDGIRAARASGASRVVALTGQDYPIKPTAAVLAFLRRQPDMSYIEHHRLPREDFAGEGGLERFDARVIRLFGHQRAWRNRRRFRALPLRRLDLTPLRPFLGDLHWSLSAEACDYLLGYIREQPQLLRTFKAVQIPDEALIHTVLGDSSLKDSLINDSLLYADWRDNSSHPATLTLGHVAALRASHALFARKFDMHSHPEVLDIVEQELVRGGEVSSY